MAAAGPGNASFPAAAGLVPSPAALPLAELFPALNDTALAQEIAADLGLVSNATTVPQASSHGGTPGWTTGLLAALISVAVIVSMVTVFVLIHRTLRRQRREVLESFLAFQEAETAALEAANNAHQRLVLARASRAAALSPRQPREPPVVVVQPDLSPSLCIKVDPSSRASGGSGGGSTASGAGASPLLPTAPAGGSNRTRGNSTAAGGLQGQAGDVPGAAAASSAAAGAASATLTEQPGEADLEAGPADAAGSGSGSGSGAAAVASPAPAPAASGVQRLTLAFPGLGATVLLLLPSGPQSAGLLLWDDGSGASVLPGASWRGWAGMPPHDPPPVFHSDIELAARGEQQQGPQQDGEQQQQQGRPHEDQHDAQQQKEEEEEQPAQQATGPWNERQEGQGRGDDSV